jgi:hypothetical protein
MQMLLEGCDPDNEDAVEVYNADHYGKHDRKQLGMNAVSWGVTRYEKHNGRITFPVYGRHRCDETFYLLDWTGPIPQDGSFVLCDTGHYSMGQHGTLRLYRALIYPTRP